MKEMNGAAVNWTVGMTLDLLERLVIQKAYRFYRFNKVATASSLGIDAKTLYNKLERYEMEDELEREKAAHDRDKQIAHLARARGQITQNEQGTSVYSRVRVESTPIVSTERSMPVQESKEVQSVLLEASTKGRQKRSSTAV